MSDKPIRILLVDDERELVDYMSKRLQKKGFTVAAAYGGHEAINQVRSHVFDVAVLDLKMPELDGIEVLKRVKEVQPFLQVIMLTGHGSMESALESGRQDAFRFLVKPYEFEALLQVIYEAHQRKRQELREAFQGELNELISSMASPHEIMSETRRLRQKYEQ